MATYREIHGKAVKSLGTDPSAETDAGQIWYNTSSDTFKTIVNLEAWSSASSAVTQMHAGQGFGSQTDAVGAGGYDPASSPGYVNPTDEYNGSGWAAGANIGTARYSGSGCGSQTAGLIAGGNDGTGGANLDVEEYNGTSWAEQTNISTGHGYGWMAGIQTAAIVYTGLSNPSPATITVNCEEYNGSSWTEVGNVNTGKYGILGFGATQDTAVKVGGGGSPNTEVEEWNGSSWTAVNSIPANRSDGMGSGAQTAGLIVAGNPGGMTSTLTYDGTNWTTSAATLSETRAANARGATIANNATGIIHHAGPGAAKMKLTEEYNSSTTAVTAGAWAAGGNLGTARYLMAGFGGPTTAVAAAGKTPPTVGNVEEYNGSSWSEETNVGTARGALGSAGTLTAGLIFGGYPAVTTTEEYDGSSWTGGGAMNTARGYNGGAGTQTAALSFGGYVAPANQTSVEKYDGSSWTASTALPNGGRQFATSGAGTQTAALAAGAIYTSPSNNALTYEFDGSSWTTGGAMNTARYGGGMAGTQSDMIYFAGSDDTKSVENYDGTSWKTNASLTTLKYNIGPAAAGTSTTAFGFGGGPPAIANSEQFTGETSALNVKTLTQS